MKNKRIEKILFDFMNSLTNEEKYKIITGEMKNEMRMFIGGLKKVVKKDK